MASWPDDYDVRSVIGTGSFGVCKKVRRRRDGKIFVCKEISYGHMREEERQKVVSEVNVLRRLRHRHIVRYHERFVDKGSSTLYIIMEYCEGGDLARLIADTKKQGRYLKEAYIWRVCGQIAEGLAACHEAKNKILHRDLKPANIFLDKRRDTKLGDFGVSKILGQHEKYAQTLVGTPYYMSPEQLSYNVYDEKSDIWSLGCLLYEMAAQLPPFTGHSHMSLVSNICRGRFCRLPRHYSDQLQCLISSMLSLQSNSRPSASQILSNPQVQQQISSTEKRLGNTVNQCNALLEKIKPFVRKLQDRETNLQTREQALGRWEKELQAKEDALRLRRRHSQRDKKRVCRHRYSYEGKEHRESSKHFCDRTPGHSKKDVKHVVTKGACSKERIASPKKDTNKLELLRAIRHGLDGVLGVDRKRTYTVPELRQLQAESKAAKSRRRLSAPETTTTADIHK